MTSKEKIGFGSGSFVGQISGNAEFFNLPEQEQAKLIGWANSCPITDELTDPNNTNPGRGPEAMRQRYAEINVWFGFIYREAQRLNPELAKQLLTSIDRHPDEPVGKYEIENVPSWHKDKISPMGQLAGYAIPRIFVEQLGTHKEGVTREILIERMDRGLAVVESAIIQAQTPLELLALTGEGLLDADCSSNDVLKHSLSLGWISEHNSPNTIEQYKEVMRTKAPRIWEAYSNLSEED